MSNAAASMMAAAGWRKRKGGGGYPFRSGAWVAAGSAPQKYRDFGTARGREVDIAHAYCSPLTSWAGLESMATQLAPFVGTEFQSGYRIMVSLPMIPRDGSATMAQVAAGTHDAHLTTIYQNLIGAGFPQIIVCDGWEFNLQGTYYSGHPQATSAQKCTPAEYAAAHVHLFNLVQALNGGTQFRFLYCPTGGYTGVASELFFAGKAYYHYRGFDTYDSWYGHSPIPGDPTYATPDARWQQVQLDTAHGANAEGADFHAAKAAALAMPLIWREWGVTNPSFNSDASGNKGGSDDDANFINKLYAWCVANCTPPGAPYQGGECVFESDTSPTVPDATSGNFRLFGSAWPKPAAQAQYKALWSTGASASTSFRYKGKALWGYDRNAVSAGRSGSYDAAMAAAGAATNVGRPYRATIRDKLNQIDATDIAGHNAGKLIVHSLRCDNTADKDTRPGGSGLPISAWAAYPLGLHDDVIDAFISQALALDFSPGKPQHVFTSFDPETSRFVNGASASSADHGTAAEYLAAHAYYYNRIRAADPNFRIAVGWCDQWYWIKWHAAQVLAVCPPDDQVDVCLMDLTYNKHESQATWAEASVFFNDFNAWRTANSRLVGKQYMCQEGDCEPYGDTYTVTTSTGTVTKRFPTGSTVLDTTRRKTFLIDKGTYVAGDPLCIGAIYWDDEFPLTDADALAGFGQGGAIAQASMKS